MRKNFAIFLKGFCEIFLRTVLFILILNFPGLIGVARVNEKRTTNVTRVLKAQGAEICQNACVVNEQKIYQCSPKCSVNKYTSIKFQLKQSWQLMKAIAEMKSETVHMMKLE